MIDETGVDAPVVDSDALEQWGCPRPCARRGPPALSRPFRDRRGSHGRGIRHRAVRRPGDDSPAAGRPAYRRGRRSRGGPAGGAPRRGPGPRRRPQLSPTSPSPRRLLPGPLRPRRLETTTAVGRTRASARRKAVNLAGPRSTSSRRASLRSPTARPHTRDYKIEAGWHAARLYAYEEAERHFVDALELSDAGDATGRCDVLLALSVRQKGATVDGAATARDAFLDAFRLRRAR